jgi:hypothetical protein
LNFALVVSLAMQWFGFCGWGSKWWVFGFQVLEE